VVARRRRRELVEHRLDHGRGEFLGRQAVAPAYHPRHGRHGQFARGRALRQRRDHVLVQRLARGARLLRAIQYGDGTHGRGEDGQEVTQGKRPEQPHLQQPDTLAARHQPVHGLAGGASARPHQHHDAFRLRRAGVLEQTVATSRARLETRHRGFHHTGDTPVEQVRGLAHLEVHVRVLRRSADERVIGVEGARAVRDHELVIHQRPQVVVREHVDAVDLVRRPEAVEEVHERHA
jgi:hypothetical protein